MYYLVNVTAPIVIYTLPLHDALPICSEPSSHEKSGSQADDTPPPKRWLPAPILAPVVSRVPIPVFTWSRSEEHTSELQSPCNLVCRLLLEDNRLLILGDHTLVVDVCL